MIRLLISVYVLVAVATEVAVLFVPNGPVNDTIRFFQTCDATKKSGLTPCEECGQPAVPVSYDRSGGFNGPGNVTLTRWCVSHAPSSYGTGSPPISHEVQMFFFFAVVALVLLLQLADVSLMWGQKAPNRPLTPKNRKNNIKRMLTTIFVWPSAYTFFTFVFFWGDHFAKMAH